MRITKNSHDVREPSVTPRHVRPQTLASLLTFIASTLCAGRASANAREHLLYVNDDVQVVVLPLPLFAHLRHPDSSYPLVFRLTRSPSPRGAFLPRACEFGHGLCQHPALVSVGPSYDAPQPIRKSEPIIYRAPRSNRCGTRCSVPSALLLRTRE